MLMTGLAIIVLQAAGVLPQEVYDALSRVNLRGGPTGAARVEFIRIDAESSTRSRNFYMRSPNGDTLTIAEGMIANGQPTEAIRGMQKSGYAAQSLSCAPVFSTQNLSPPTDPRRVRITDGGVASSMRLPRMMFDLVRPLHPEDVASVELVSRPDERLQQYRIETDLPGDSPDWPPQRVYVTYDVQKKQVVRTMPCHATLDSGPVFDLTYDEQGSLKSIQQRPPNGGEPSFSWELASIDLSPQAAPAELDWELIGMGKGAQIMGPLPGSNEPPKSITLWTGDTAVPQPEWASDHAGTAAPIILMQYQEARHSDALTYEFAKQLFDVAFAKQQFGIDDATPWDLLVLEVGRAVNYSESERKRAERVLERAEGRLREIAYRFDDGRGNEGQLDSLELQAMRNQPPNRTDEVREEAVEEFRRARELFEDFWKEIKTVKSGDYARWDDRFQTGRKGGK